MEAAEALNTVDRNNCVPQWTVRQAEISPLSNDDPKDTNDHTLGTFQIKASDLHKLLEQGHDAGTVLQVLNVMQKRQRCTPDPNANIPGDIYRELLPNFNKQWTNLSRDEHMKIL